MSKEYGFYILKTPRYHGGRLISNQGEAIRKAAAENASRLRFLSHESNIDLLCRFFLDAMTHKDAVSSGNTGGHLVPSEVVPDIFELARNSSIALRHSRLHVVGTGREITVPKELTHGSLSWVGESTQDTPSEPTFSAATLQLKGLRQTVEITNELLEDQSYDVVSHLFDQFTYLMASELDNQVFNGTGDPVSGLLTAACGYSTTLSGTAFSTIVPANITSSIAKIQEGRYKDLRFIVGRTQNHLLHSSSTAQLNPVVDPFDKLNRLYGFPVEVCEKVSSTDGSGKPFGVIGNFKSYILVRHKDLAFQRDPYGKFDTNVTRLRFMSRWAFDIGDANSFCRLMTA